MKETIIYHTDWNYLIDILPEDLQAKFWKCFMHYSPDFDIESIKEPQLKSVVTFIFTQIGKSNSKYDRRKETSAENGRLGGRKPKEKFDKENLNNLTENPNNLGNNLNKPIENLNYLGNNLNNLNNPNDNDNDNDNDNKNANVNGNIDDFIAHRKIEFEKYPNWFKTSLVSRHGVRGPLVYTTNFVHHPYSDLVDLLYQSLNDSDWIERVMGSFTEERFKEKLHDFFAYHLRSNAYRTKDCMYTTHYEFQNHFYNSFLNPKK